MTPIVRIFCKIRNDLCGAQKEDSWREIPQSTSDETICSFSDLEICSIEMIISPYKLENCNICLCFSYINPLMSKTFTETVELPDNSRAWLEGYSVF